MLRPPLITILGLLTLTILASPLPARAADSEGCLNCHQYRGLARIADDGKTIQRFYVDPSYYSQGLGPHARLKCTDCHNRTEVEVFPHHKITAVDCGKTCHLASDSKLEARFSHQSVVDMLRSSVHGGDALGKSNKILGSPLRDDQTQCLLCHDEPTFARTRNNWAKQQAPIKRCDTCHDEQLPQNTRFSYWHVHARSQPARSHQEIVKVCGLCHSDRRIQQEFNLPSAVSSYLASFHGKAILLGSTEAAGCLDCHVGPMQNVHQILGRKDSKASINPDQVADTCRTPTCHPTAGQKISSAAIHLNLPTSRGIEFLIACMFVLLIIFTFGPSLLLTVSKMLQIVVGRNDPSHEHHLHITKELLANPLAKQKLTRFTIHQRVQHWVLVICFATLVLTGFPIKFADRVWAAWLIGQFGGLPMARLFHRWAGAMLIAGFIYHMIYIFYGVIQARRRTGQSWFKIVWELPMLVRPTDSLEMLDLLLYVLFLKKKRPAGARFNPEEKFEYIGVFWGTFVLATTGILMWANAWTSRHMAGRILTIAMLVHTFEAFLALLHVGIVHMATVILSPGVFPISPAMFNGQTPPEELVEGHGGMLAKVEAELHTPHEAAPSPVVSADQGTTHG
ncbi:MAG: cytochrome b/b6 domain-containing protein [Bacillota bacterium]